MAEKDTPTTQSIRREEPSQGRRLRLNPQGVKAAELIPPWMLVNEPAIWRCDSRVLAGSGSYKEASLRELAAIWCGFDPERFNTASEFASAIQHWRKFPKECSDKDQLYIVKALDRTVEAVRSGAAQLLYLARDPDDIEGAVMDVAEFRSWAKSVRLCRPPDPRSCTANSWGNYMTESLRLLPCIVETFYRLKEDGGSYDPANPTTHPHPADIRAKLRQLKPRIARTEMDRLIAIARDPRIPVGRRRRRQAVS